MHNISKSFFKLYISLSDTNPTAAMMDVSCDWEFIFAALYNVYHHALIPIVKMLLDISNCGSTTRRPSTVDFKNYKSFFLFSFSGQFSFPASRYFTQDR